MSTKVIAYHFVGDRLRDGRRIPAIGAKLVHTGPLCMCASGLHASMRPFDALTYAPGTVLCRVLCEGAIEIGRDKLVCTERTILQKTDVAGLLSHFARMQALSVVCLWRPPQHVLDYLVAGGSLLGRRIFQSFHDDGMLGEADSPEARDARQSAVEAAGMETISAAYTGAYAAYAARFADQSEHIARKVGTWPTGETREPASKAFHRLVEEEFG